MNTWIIENKIYKKVKNKEKSIWWGRFVFMISLENNGRGSSYIVRAIFLFHPSLVSISAQQFCCLSIWMIFVSKKIWRLDLQFKMSESSGWTPEHWFARSCTTSFESVSITNLTIKFSWVASFKPKRIAQSYAWRAVPMPIYLV